MATISYRSFDTSGLGCEAFVEDWTIHKGDLTEVHASAYGRPLFDPPIQLGPTATSQVHVPQLKS